ncbi:hypothetical protein RRG08_026743 [Elysia crispata]|uniref:Uncharacterized protein n=1 Tax=Elysia crispata TaxID=231223 RepID=A0AAE1APU9_9GAST|nr:hypothetical protein RRG08_026743 [Elysia crispata]
MDKWNNWSGEALKIFQKCLAFKAFVVTFNDTSEVSGGSGQSLYNCAVFLHPRVLRNVSPRCLVSLDSQPLSTRVSCQLSFGERAARVWSVGIPEFGTCNQHGQTGKREITALGTPSPAVAGKARRRYVVRTRLGST